MRHLFGVAEAIALGKTHVIDLDLRSYFDGIRHHLLLEKVAKRINDEDVMHLLKLLLKANGKRGVGQGSVLAPLLSNLYLNEVDRMLERAKEYTRFGQYTGIEYARFADDLVVLIHAHPSKRWLLTAVPKRLRQELAKLQVQINEEKSRNVDLVRGESFAFLGFDFRRVRSLNGRWRPQYTPRLMKRTALLRQLREIFWRYRSQPVQSVVTLINPILRGWVNYFAIGHSSRCFQLVKRWVELKIRRHLRRARNRRGLGWAEWSTPRLYAAFGLFNGYNVRPALRWALRAHLWSHDS
jgi:RNA-directed DNA polymerase